MRILRTDYDEYVLLADNMTVGVKFSKHAFEELLNAFWMLSGYTMISAIRQEPVVVGPWKITDHSDSNPGPTKLDRNLYLSYCSEGAYHCILVFSIDIRGEMYTLFSKARDMPLLTYRDRGLLEYAKIYQIDFKTEN